MVSLSAMVRPGGTADGAASRPPHLITRARAPSSQLQGAEETRPGRGGREAAARAQPKFSPGIKGRGEAVPARAGRSGAGPGPGPAGGSPRSFPRSAGFGAGPLRCLFLTVGFGAGPLSAFPLVWGLGPDPPHPFPYCGVWGRTPLSLPLSVGFGAGPPSSFPLVWGLGPDPSHPCPYCQVWGQL